MKKFTLLDYFTIGTIIFIFLLLCLGSYSALTSDKHKYSPFWNPEAAQAKATQDLAREMAEQNRLMRENIK